jgi:hypothetical protein
MEDAMKHAIVGATLALVCGLAVSASAAKRPATKPAVGHQMALTGCLRTGTEPNTFKLTDATGMHAKQAEAWELVASPDLKLGDHVGHKVEVRGMTVGMREAERLEGEHEHGPGKGAKKEMKEERKEHHFKVIALKHISPSCP